MHIWGENGDCLAYDLGLCGESKENLKVMVEHFVELRWIIGLKVNVNKSKVMILGGEDGLLCKVFVDGR